MGFQLVQKSVTSNVPKQHNDWRRTLSLQQLSMFFSLLHALTIIFLTYRSNNNNHRHNIIIISYLSMSMST